MADALPELPPAHLVDVAGEWAAVADAVVADPPADAVHDAAAPPRPADLRGALADFAARRDLRRILIAFGAIGGGRARSGPSAPARAEDVVGAIMGAPAPLLHRMLTSAGAVADADRVERFATSIAAIGSTCDPRQPVAVCRWIAAVAAVLRDEGSATAA